MYELNYITDEKELNFVKNKINEYKANVQGVKENDKRRIKNRSKNSRSTKKL